MSKKRTLIGKYLDKLGIRPSRIGDASGINPKNITLLSTQETRKIYADEFYKIIYTTHLLSDIPEEQFKRAIDEIFPNRTKIDLLAEYKNLPPEAKFFKKYTQTQSEIEKKLVFPSGKISKYNGAKDDNRKALAIEIISFSEGMGLDVLKAFKDIYGEINLDKLPSEK